MYRSSLRATLIIGIMLMASTALANNWKTMVTQAGGHWESKVHSAGWNNKIIATNSEQVLRRLPAGVQTMLKSEILDNPWLKGHEEMQTKLGKFRPEARQVFDLPYIPIPADKMKFKYESSGIGQNMKDNVSYMKDGKRMVRYFFHPLYADKYKELIETYGVRYGEYQATSTSSPRSLITWKKDSPNKPVWVKVSLHAHLDYYTRREKDGTEKKIGISRVQSQKKANRSALVNAAFGTAGRSELARHRLDYMAEPASFVPGDIQYKGARRGFDRATIFREMPASLTAANPSTKFIPAFTFIKNMKSTLATINGERRQAGKKPVNPIGWMTKGLIEPLIRSYIYLGMEHGLQGELHTQNFLLEVNKKGVPTGKVMVKDLDGFRMDLDMRIRNGRSLDFLSHFKHPFAWAKHGAAMGSTTYPAVLQAWFNKLIRNVNGFTTTRTIDGQTHKVYATPSGQLMVQLKKDFPDVFAQLQKQAMRRDPSLRRGTEKVEQKAIEQVFDLVGKAQFRRITGVRIKKANWGYGQNKGLNNGLLTLRTELFKSQKGLGASLTNGQWNADANAQRVLSKTYNRLRLPAERKADERTWIRGNPRKFRLLGDGVIEGISKGGKSVGYAILKPNDVTKLHSDLRTAGLQAPSRVRPTSHLKKYSASDFSAKRPFSSLFRSNSNSQRRTATQQRRTRRVLRRR